MKYNGTDMVRQLCREDQSVTDAAGDALPQCVIEALDMLGVARALRDGLMLRRGNDPGVDSILLGIEGRLRAVHCRKIGPQRLRALVTAITDVEGNALPRLLVHSDPHPLLVGLFRHAAPPLICFHLQTPDAHLPGSRYRPHME